MLFSVVLTNVAGTEFEPCDRRGTRMCHHGGVRAESAYLGRLPACTTETT
jgi:hypothetical protein